MCETIFQSVFPSKDTLKGKVISLITQVAFFFFSFPHLKRINNKIDLFFRLVYKQFVSSQSVSF